MRYKAFISYSKDTDSKLASEIQSALQNIAKPWYKLRSIRVFRDETGLSAGSELWPSIEAELKEAEYLLRDHGFDKPAGWQTTWIG